MLRMEWQKKHFNVSTLKDSASERHINNYKELELISLNGETSHSQTYTKANEDTDVVTRKALFRIFFQICNLCNKRYCNGFMSTLC